jgi:uncharacterized protein YxjI
MENLNYPLKLTFKIGTLANDFVIRDANQSTVAYVRQKMFKFVDEIQVFTNEKKTELTYTIKANKWIDFSASYLFKDADGNQIGRVARKGVASIWKARYDVFDNSDDLIFHIQEENAWTKVFDAILGQLPIISIFTGYFFNPAYKVMRNDGTMVTRLKKDASFFGRSFSVTKEGEMTHAEEESIVLSLMMMILLERKRG